MKQIEIIPEIKRLCGLGQYDEAISLARVIISRPIATRAEEIVISHRQDHHNRAPRFQCSPRT